MFYSSSSKSYNNTKIYSFCTLMFIFLNISYYYFIDHDISKIRQESNNFTKVSLYYL